MGKAHRDKMIKKAVSPMEMDMSNVSARLAVKRRKDNRKAVLKGGSNEMTDGDVVARKRNKVTNFDLIKHPKMLAKLKEAKNIQKASGTDKKTKTGITQKADFIKHQMKGQVAKNIDTLEKVLQDMPGHTFNENDSLLHWLSSQRRALVQDILDPGVLEQLKDLERYGFNWLHATFRWGPFKKSLKVRQEWTGDKRNKLTTDAWCKEQHKAFMRGELPPDAAEAVKILLNV